jgi:hypothetical protein
MNFSLSLPLSHVTPPWIERRGEVAGSKKKKVCLSTQEPQTQVLLVLIWLQTTLNLQLPLP